MGYTQYWFRQPEIDRETFKSIVQDFRKIVQILPTLPAEEGCEVKLAGGLGKGAPEICEEGIVFNGCGEGAHETFDFPRTLVTQTWKEHEEYGLRFEFCNTAQKPYDIAVTAFLVIAQHYLKEKIKVSSDGDDSDWDAARNLCQSILGYGVEFKLPEESEVTA